ncbi:nucleotidyl transferase AbiEii/AbiGii toxin family protein [Fusibacter bizertensis]
MADSVASTLARLKQHSKIKGIQLQQVLNLFCQEEFLRRISKSDYREKLILKGGFLLYTISGFETRPTVDSDYLLKNYSNGVDEIEKMVIDIIGTSTAYDFIKLQIKKIEIIGETKEYHGIRVNLIGIIGNTKTPFSIDLGIGDVIIPSAIEREIKVILDDYECPFVNTYSLESSISEKLDSIIFLMEATGRMKDFYDIYYLASNFNFDGSRLQKAIYETLKNRNREMRSDAIIVLNRLKDNSNIQIRWRNFCKKILKYDLEIDNVIDVIIKIIEPPYEAITNQELFKGEWSSEELTYY